MIPVLQTKFGNGEGEAAGNCLQAALASLFDLPLDSVPHFVAEPGSRWWSAMQEWLLREHSCFVVWASREQCPPFDMHESYYLQVGKSPRGDFNHIIVARNGELAHDPHPDGTGLVEVTGDYLFVRMFR